MYDIIHVRPSERSFKRNSQYAKALDELVRAGDALTDGLTEKQEEIIEGYMTAQREVNVITDCETFIYAFRGRKDHDRHADRGANERNIVRKYFLVFAKCMRAGAATPALAVSFIMRWVIHIPPWQAVSR